MKYVSQPRIKGLVRKWSGEALDPLIVDALKEIQREYANPPSLSWLKATILADALDIKVQPRFYLTEVLKKRKRRRAS